MNAYSSGESLSRESNTHCCPSAATMEGPWSKVLNPPLLEWSCTGLNNKLRVSTHVTSPLPPLHHTAAVSRTPDGKLGSRRKEKKKRLYYRKENTEMCKEKNKTSRAADGLISWKVELD